MLNNYFTNFFLFNLTNLWLYFSIHISLSLFFSIHFFFVKFFKFKIDLKNSSLKNYKNYELIRSISNTIKSIFIFDKQINFRYYYYLTLK